jgi:hypothetical protein
MTTVKKRIVASRDVCFDLESWYPHRGHIVDGFVVSYICAVGWFRVRSTSRPNDCGVNKRHMIITADIPRGAAKINRRLLKPRGVDGESPGA